MLIDLKPQPGTIKAPQQTLITAPCYTDTDHVHFKDGVLTTIPPYSITVQTGDDGVMELFGGLRCIHASKLSGTNAGTYFFFATHSHLYVLCNGTLYNITPLETSSTALANNPITTSNGSSIVTVAQTAHGKAVGDRVKLSGASTFNGVDAANINKEHIILTVPDANSFTVDTGDAASASGAGGGASVVLFKQINAGNLSQAASFSAYGAGIYGEGIYGQGGPSVTVQSYPRISSMANFGNEVLYCPGDYTTGDGQKIYAWDGDLAVAPTVLLNAPTNCNWITVVNNAVVALCGRTIRISEIGDATVWTGDTTYTKTLERVWRLIAACVHAEKNAVIFTPTEALILRYVGGTDLWDIADLYLDDGLLGPNAWAVLDTVVYWRGARGMYAYDGGYPARLENSQNEDWVNQNINYAHAWKSFLMADTDNTEIWFYFPTGSDEEPGDYQICNPKGGHWTLGLMERTAAQRPGFIDSTFYMGNGTSADEAASVFRHFTNGAVTFNWSATEAFAYGSGGQQRIIVRRILPDGNQDGNVTLYIDTKETPRGAITTSGPYTITPTTDNLSVRAAGHLIRRRMSGSSAFTAGAEKMDIMLHGTLHGAY